MTAVAPASPSVLESFEQGALRALSTAIAANPALLEGGISTIETDIQAGIVNLAKNLPAVKGISAIVVGPLEQAAMSAIEGYVASWIAAHTPAQIESLIVTYINTLAGKV